MLPLDLGALEPETVQTDGVAQHNTADISMHTAHKCSCEVQGRPPREAGAIAYRDILMHACAHGDHADPFVSMLHCTVIQGHAAKSGA